MVAHSAYSIEFYTKRHHQHFRTLLGCTTTHAAPGSQNAKLGHWLKVFWGQNGRAHFYEALNPTPKKAG
jgi:hypothetical protein